MVSRPHRHAGMLLNMIEIGGNMRLIIVLLSTYFFGLGVSGCAALFNQNSEPVTITSQPSGAQAFVDGNPIGRTPANTKLSASDNHLILVRMKGYEDKSTILNYHVGAGWVILDILTAIIPVIIDAVTESWYELDENSVHVVLNKGP